MMPVDLLSTTLDVEVRVKGDGVLLVLWNATSDSSITGFRLVLRRGNDSMEEADMTLAAEVTRYLFTIIAEEQAGFRAGRSTTDQIMT